MHKVTATYKAPPGDSKVVEVFGHTFFDGKAEEISVDERTLGKLRGNSNFVVGEGSDPKPDPKHDPKPDHHKSK